MAVAFAAHVVVCQAAQLFVDDRHELLSRGGIAVGPVGQEPGDAFPHGGFTMLGHRRVRRVILAYGVSPRPSKERLLRRDRIEPGQEDTVANASLRTAVVVVFIALVSIPARTEAAIDSVTVSATRDYANAAGYTYAEITIRGSVVRADGSVGLYSVPAVLIYPSP